MVVFQEFSDSTKRGDLCNLIKNITNCFTAPMFRSAVGSLILFSCIQQEVYFQRRGTGKSQKTQVFCRWSPVGKESPPRLLEHWLSMTKLPSAGKLNVFVYADFGALPDFLVLAAWLFPVPLKKKRKKENTHTSISKSPCILCLLNYSDS